MAKIPAWEDKVRGNRLVKAAQDPPLDWMGRGHRGRCYVSTSRVAAIAMPVRHAGCMDKSPHIEAMLETTAAAQLPQHASELDSASSGSWKPRARHQRSAAAGFHTDSVLSDVDLRKMRERAEVMQLGGQLLFKGMGDLGCHLS